MTWQEVCDRFSYLVADVEILSEKEHEGYLFPDRVYVYCVAENVSDDSTILRRHMKEGKKKRNTGYPYLRLLIRTAERIRFVGKVNPGGCKPGQWKVDHMSCARMQ